MRAQTGKINLKPQIQPESTKVLRAEHMETIKMPPFYFWVLNGHETRRRGSPAELDVAENPSEQLVNKQTGLDQRRNET